MSARDPLSLPKAPELIATLTEADFLGGPLRDRDGGFTVGERFLQLIAFAGCSVQVSLSPRDGSPFCHIRLTGPFDRPVFLHGRNTRPPRCRNCRSPLRDWRTALLDRSEFVPNQVPCPTCGEANSPWNYDWKEKAGFGRLFIQIEEIFPGEAVPTPALMELLEGTTHTAWRYFYVQDG